MFFKVYVKTGPISGEPIAPEMKRINLQGSSLGRQCGRLALRWGVLARTFLLELPLGHNVETLFQCWGEPGVVCLLACRTNKEIPV